ncbi:MAG TPA: ATP synthase F0 subunit B [Oligoflexia bacterium]|nr:ATP synthase F0 subunit B [Oligoflexia bacterium]HMP48161.1 ATP synthase F0 subunit B [Oligoflexia bacterium]
MIFKFPSILFLPLICFALFSSSDVFAAGSASSDIGTLLWPSINFALYLFLMIFIYRRFARPVLRNQKIEVESAVVKAQNEYATLESEYEQVRRQLENVAEEKTRIISELEEQGGVLASEIVALANQKAERLLSDVRIRVASETQKLSGEVLEVMLDGALGSVRNRLSTSFTESDDARFIKSVIGNLQASGERV